LSFGLELSNFFVFGRFFNFSLSLPVAISFIDALNLVIKLFNGCYDRDDLAIF
jgi:hypothetical protein